MNQALIGSMNPSIYGLQTPDVIKNWSILQKEPIEWKLNPIFKNQRYKFPNWFNIDSRLSISSCLLTSNNQVQKFTTNQEFSYQELSSLQDQDIFPNFPKDIENFQSLRIQFKEKSSQMRILAHLNAEGKLKYQFFPRDQPQFLMTTDVSNPKKLLIKYENIPVDNLPINLWMEITAFDIKFLLFEERGPQIKLIINNTTKSSIQVEFKEQLSIQRIEICDLEILWNYCQTTMENFKNLSKKQEKINPLELNKWKQLKEKLLSLVNSITGFQGIIVFFNDIKTIFAVLTEFLKKHQIENYSMLYHFYKDLDVDHGDLMIGINIYTHKKAADEVDALEDEFEQQEFRKIWENVKSEFTIEFWPGDLE